MGLLYFYIYITYNQAIIGIINPFIYTTYDQAAMGIMNTCTYSTYDRAVIGIINTCAYTTYEQAIIGIMNICTYTTFGQAVIGNIAPNPYLFHYYLRPLCREGNYGIKQGLGVILAKSSNWEQAAPLNYKLHICASFTLKCQ